MITLPEKVVVSLLPFFETERGSSMTTHLPSWRCLSPCDDRAVLTVKLGVHGYPDLLALVIHNLFVDLDAPGVAAITAASSFSWLCRTTRDREGAVAVVIS